MRQMHVDRSLLAVLAVPLAALTVAGGTLAVTALDAARDPRRVDRAASAEPRLVALERAVQTERSTALAALAHDPAAGARLAAERAATDAVVAPAMDALALLRGDPGPVADAARRATQVVVVLRQARHAVDGGVVGAAEVEAAYAGAIDQLTAVPAGVAAVVPDQRLGRPLARFVAALQAAESAARVQLAGDAVLRSGRSLTREQLDALAARRALLARDLATLASTGGTPGDGAVLADLTRLQSNLAARSGAATWDAAGRRVVTALESVGRSAAVAAHDAAGHATLVRLVQALAAVGLTLTVVVAGLSHAYVVARRLGTGAVPRSAVLVGGALTALRRSVGRLLDTAHAATRAAGTASVPAPRAAGDADLAARV